MEAEALSGQGGLRQGQSLGKPSIRGRANGRRNWRASAALPKRVSMQGCLFFTLGTWPGLNFDSNYKVPGAASKFTCAALLLKTLQWIPRRNFRPLGFGLVWTGCVVAELTQRAGLVIHERESTELSNPCSPFRKPGFQDNCLAKGVKKSSIWTQNRSSVLGSTCFCLAWADKPHGLDLWAMAASKCNLRGK